MTYRLEAEMAYCLSLKMGRSFVSQKGQTVCPSKWAGHCLSKRVDCLFFKKGRLFVSQKGQTVCPSKWTGHLSLKKG